MDELQKKLLDLGLSGHEPAIYTYLLKHTPSGASAIAKKCSLSRSSVYTSLQGLIEKGLVSVTHQNEVKQFIAHEYDAVEEMLQHQEQQLNERFSVLKSIQADLVVIDHNETKPDVSFFAGQEGLKKVYLSMMRQAKSSDILYLMRDEFVWQPDWQFIFEANWSSRTKRIKKEKGIKTLLLVNDSPIERDAVKTYTTKKRLQFRFLAKEHSLKDFATYILGDTVAIMSMEENHLVGIQIINKNLARNHKSVFESLWESSKHI